MLRSGKLPMETRLRVLSCYAFSILTYGSESWAISRTMERRLESAEKWFYHLMQHISWMDHISNEEVLRRIGGNRHLLSAIQMQQLKFVVYIIQKDSLEKVGLTGKGERKRDLP